MYPPIFVIYRCRLGNFLNLISEKITVSNRTPMKKRKLTMYGKNSSSLNTQIPINTRM
jgi:hypothetical protein